MEKRKNKKEKGKRKTEEYKEKEGRKTNYVLYFLLGLTRKCAAGLFVLCSISGKVSWGNKGGGYGIDNITDGVLIGPYKYGSHHMPKQWCSKGKGGVAQGFHSLGVGNQIKSHSEGFD